MDALPVNKLSTEISINLKSKIFSRAGTIAFWAFMENTASLLDKLLSIIITNKMMLSLGKSATGGISAICSSQIEFYPNIPASSASDKSFAGITSYATLIAQKNDSEKSIKEKSFATAKDKIWFHVKCSYSVEAKTQYIAMHSKDASSELIDSGAIKAHNYLKTFEIDYPFRTFLEQQLIIRSPGIISSLMLIKNLAVFADYIPSGVNFEY